MTEALDALAKLRGRPKSLRVNNGPEFAGRMLDQWASLNGVEIDFSRLGEPTDNADIESFNGRLRAECSNASWVLSLADARERIEASRCHYNEDRPFTALGGLTPRAFANQDPWDPHTARELDRSWTTNGVNGMRSGSSPYGRTKIRWTLSKPHDTIAAVFPIERHEPADVERHNSHM